MAAEQTGFASPPYRLAQAQAKWHTVTNSGEASLQGYTAEAQVAALPAHRPVCAREVRGPALTISCRSLTARLARVVTDTDTYSCMYGLPQPACPKLK